MTALEDIEVVFSILHDGSITAWSGDTNLLTLTIECQYLAECIDKSYSRFDVKLTQVEELLLTTWPKPIELPVQRFTKPDDIFKAELEILTANIKDGRVVIACRQDNKDFDYSGGNLTLRCKAIKISDQNKNEISIAQFKILGKRYWDEFKSFKGA